MRNVLRSIATVSRKLLGVALAIQMVSTHAWAQGASVSSLKPLPGSSGKPSDAGSADGVSVEEAVTFNKKDKNRGGGRGDHREGGRGEYQRDNGLGGPEEWNSETVRGTEVQRVADRAAGKMGFAQVPANFECPLFSNSPYQDILGALDNLQSAIQLYPDCNSDQRVKAVKEDGAEIQKQLQMAQKAQETVGGAAVDPKSIETLIDKAVAFQNRLSDLSANPGTCYQSRDPMKVMFSINDTFQSIAPLALDFATKNPGISSRLLPVLTGAQAISSGIATLQKVLQNTITLDMKDPNNRRATIKNTCQFMKIYNRIEYLQLAEAGDLLAKINKDFEAQIKPQVAKTGFLSKAIAQNKVNMTDEEKSLLTIEDSVKKNMGMVQEAIREIEADDSLPSVCRVMQTLIRKGIVKSINVDMMKTGGIVSQQEMLKNVEAELVFKRDKLTGLETQAQIACARFNKADLKDIRKTVESALQRTLELIARYRDLQKQSVEAVRVSRDRKEMEKTETKVRNLVENKQKLSKFTELAGSDFEPSETFKTINELPKILFNGPSKFTFYGSDHTFALDSDFWSAQVGQAKIGKLKKNGPVYDLLMDDKLWFENALKDYRANLKIIQKFEQTFFEAEHRLAVFSYQHNNQKQVIQYYAQLAEAKKTLPHIDLRLLPKGSLERKEVCDGATQAIKKYFEATKHIGASQYLCKMIDPALKDQTVSATLKDYCQNPNGGYREEIRKLLTNKNEVEVVMDRFVELQCGEETL